MSDAPQNPTESGRPTSRQVTAELLARYDSAGPRYTSYPTAVEFDEAFAAAEYGELLADLAGRLQEPLSIYIHLPFCEERCLFCACNVIITPHKERARPYLDLLKAEIDMVSERLGSPGSFSQLHLGGGTPTYFEPRELEGLLLHLLKRFDPVGDFEMAIEVDPRVTTREHLTLLSALGFNRLSLGVQDLDEEVQRSIHRVQTREETAQIIDWGRELGFSGTNVDLIYGLPRQDAGRFEQTVRWVIEQGVDRAAVYSFAYVPWIHPKQRSLGKEGLPEREEKLALFSLARELFLDAGYEPIGMDHFARPGDELARAKREGRLRRNFQGYTVLPAMDVLGFGISAIGDVGGAFVQNHKKLSRYEHEVRGGRLPVGRGRARSRDDRIRGAVIHELMCNFFVEPATIEDRFGIDFATYFAQDLDRLAGHAREGMVRVSPERIEVTAVGELFVRNLAMCFDRYWWEKHRNAEKPIFSRTV